MSQLSQGLNGVSQSECKLKASIWKPAWGNHLKDELFFVLFFRDFAFLFLPIEFLIFSVFDYYSTDSLNPLWDGTSVLMNEPWLSVYLEGTFL